MLRKNFVIVEEDYPCWHYPESVDYLGSICGKSLWNGLLHFALAPTIALATGCYLAASAFGAPPEVIRIAAVKPLGKLGSVNRR